MRLLPRLLRGLHTLESHGKIIHKQAEIIDTLKARLDKLEGREQTLVAKMETAATRVTADFAGRIGHIEGLLAGREQTPRLPHAPTKKRGH